MEILTPGHRYGLFYFERPSHHYHILQFIEKIPFNDLPEHLKPMAMEKILKELPNPESFDGKSVLVTLHNGTTNEEVLKVLIDRMQYLQKALPCRENAIVITKLEESLMWLEKRTADRKARGVEGKHEN